jgi:DnaK suppressor protein
MNELPELTPEVLAELHARLEQKRDRLRNQITALRVSEGAGTPPIDEPGTDAPEDTGDMSVDLQQQDQTRATVIELRAALAEVEHALAKFEQGTYGQCEECDGPIPLARLRAFPEARYDVRHQAALEARIAQR